MKNAWIKIASYSISLLESKQTKFSIQTRSKLCDCHDSWVLEEIGFSHSKGRSLTWIEGASRYEIWNLFSAICVVLRYESRLESLLKSTINCLCSGCQMNLVHQSIRVSWLLILVCLQAKLVFSLFFTGKTTTNRSNRPFSHRRAGQICSRVRFVFPERTHKINASLFPWPSHSWILVSSLLWTTLPTIK